MSHQRSAPSSFMLPRAAGVLLGQACGDALGVPYEFASPPGATELAEMRGGGLGPYAPGEWSDDTQMAICIAQVAAAGIDLSSDEALDRIAQGFLDWSASGATDIGTQTGSVLSAARHASGPAGRRCTSAATAYAEQHPHSAGNGALMRTAIVGISALDDRDATAAAARAVASLTHADPLAGDSCVIWCEAIRLAALEGRFDVRAGLDLLPDGRQDQWAKWLDDAESHPLESFKPNGFTVTALQAAWAAIVQTAVPSNSPRTRSYSALHFQQALHAAIRIGGDTDTVAAIAGGLLGARWGVSAVPAAWRSLVHGWPGLRARDLVTMAVLTAGRGKSGPYGWPTASHIEYPGASSSVPVVPHPYDEGVTLGSAWPNQHETDVVVSLCLLGTDRLHLPPVPLADQLDVWLIDRDDPAENPHLEFLLADTAAFVAAQRDQGRRVYVHCVAAHQRTPSVALAYAALRGHDPREAADAIRTALPSARGHGRLWDVAAQVPPVPQR